MLREAFDFLYGSVPVSFSTDLTIEQAIARLRSMTTRSMFVKPFQVSIYGVVSSKKVTLSRLNLWVRNSFQLVFSGNFEIQNEKTILQGKFSLHSVVRVFTTFWFGFIIIWNILVIFLTLSQPSQLSSLPLFGLGMFGAGVFFVYIGKWLAAEDQRLISEVIEKALSS